MIESDTSLDNSVQSATDIPDKRIRREWTRQQKRAFQRLNTVTHYWFSRGYSCNFMTLTSAKGFDLESQKGKRDLITYHHQMLKKRVEKQFGFEGIEHFFVKTAEGNGVLHVLWAWLPPNDSRTRTLYIPQKWLSREWERIHGAPVVWVTKVKHSDGSRRKLTKYMITQYVTNQRGFLNIGWSWKRTLGIPIAGFWKGFIKHYGFKDGVRFWNEFIEGNTILNTESEKVLNLKIASFLYRTFAGVRKAKNVDIDCCFLSLERVKAWGIAR